MPLTLFVRVRAQVEGLHHWPDAEPPDAYLAQPHRHLFVIDLQIGVRHDDRDIEINALSRWLTALLPTFAAAPDRREAPLDFATLSCEQLATRVIEAVGDRHGDDRSIECTVWEDGLLGGGVRWCPDPVPPP